MRQFNIFGKFSSCTVAGRTQQAKSLVFLQPFGKLWRSTPFPFPHRSQLLRGSGDGTSKTQELQGKLKVKLENNGTAGGPSADIPQCRNFPTITLDFPRWSETTIPCETLSYHYSRNLDIAKRRMTFFLLLFKS